MHYNILGMLKVKYLKNILKQGKLFMKQCWMKNGLYKYMIQLC